MKTLADMWAQNERVYGDETALIYEGRRTSHAELVSRGRRLANALAGLGVRPQDRVSMLAMNCPEWFDYYVACELAGYIAGTLNFRLAEPELEYILGDSTPRVVIFEAQYAKVMASLRKKLPDIEAFICIGQGAEVPDWALPFEETLLAAPDSAAATRPTEDYIVRLIYTSGTTGKPKGAARSHAAELACAKLTALTSEQHFGGKQHVCMPMFHVGAQLMALAMHWCGGAVVLHRRFEPEQILRDIAAEGITNLHLAPNMVADVLNSPEIGDHDTSSIRAIIYGSAPMPVTVLKRGLEIFGPVFINKYGCTECSGITALFPTQHKPDGSAEDIARLGSVGQAHYESRVRIVDDDGDECPPGTPGEVLAASPAVMSYYWNQSAATLEAKRDGWFHTGDVGYLDEQGFLYLVDRKKDVIITGGENVYCREVEEALMEQGDIAEIAVVGVPDEKWGEAVKAVVVLRQGREISAAELIAFCRTRIAGYKCPKSIDFVAELPRVASGKIDKKAIRASYR